jgi:hypothetical protein
LVTPTFFVFVFAVGITVGKEFLNEIICFKDFSQIRLLKRLSNVSCFLSSTHCSAEGSYLGIDESGPSRALVLLDTEDGGTTITRSVRNTDPTKER